MDKHALDLYLATPAIWTPEMDAAKWQAELDQMLLRSQMAHQFVDGIITPDQFENALHELGVDVIATVEGWNEGDRYL